MDYKGYAFKFDTLSGDYYPKWTYHKDLLKQPIGEMKSSSYFRYKDKRFIVTDKIVFKNDDINHYAQIENIWRFVGPADLIYEEENLYVDLHLFYPEFNGTFTPSGYRIRLSGDELIVCKPNLFKFNSDPFHDSSKHLEENPSPTFRTDYDL